MKRGEPFNVLRNPNSWSNAPRAEAIVLSIAGLQAGTAAATAYLASTAGLLATTAVSLGLSVATSAIISALTPAPPSPKQSLLVNSRDAAAPQEFVYGEVRKGGPITYLETTRGGSVLYMVIPLAAHEIESVEAVYINDEVARITGDSFGPNGRGREGAGWVLNDNWTDDPGEHEIRIFYHLGNQTSITDTFANSSVESLDSVFFNTGSSDEDSQNFGGVGQPTKASFVGNGIAYMFVRFGYAASVFQNGIPTITARIKGKKVYDPRDTSTAYSNNAALCIRDFLTSTYGLNDSNVNDTVFSAAANTCDEVVDLAALSDAWSSGVSYQTASFNIFTGVSIPVSKVSNDGFNYVCILSHTSSASTEPGVGVDWETYWELDTEKRYTLNGVVNAGQPYGDVLQQMVTSCAGTLFWGGGKWKLTVGEYNAPSKTFTLDDLRSDINLQTRTNLRDQFNKVQGTFVDQDNRYIVADYPPVESATFLAQDDGVEQPLDLDLPFTTSSATAQRLAKMTLFRGREQMVFSADFGLSAFEVEVGEIVALTIDRYGWTSKEFEVVGWNFNSSSEGGDLRVTLTLRETSSAAFSWTAEESEIISNNSELQLNRVFNLDGITTGFNDNGDISVPPLGVDEINLAPNLELNAYASRPIASALGSNPPISSSVVTAGLRYIISTVGTTNWASIDKTATAVNGGTYSVGDEILVTGTATGTGECFAGRKELIPGDNIEFIQAYYHEATLNYTVYQNHFGGAWGVWPRQTSDSEYNLNGGTVREIIYDDGTLDAIEQSVYDSFSEFLLREPEKGYTVTAQDAIDYPSGPPAGTLVNFWDYQRRYAGLSEIEMRSQHRGSLEYADTWKTLSEDYNNNRITNVAQNSISGSLPIEIVGGSFTAGAIVSGDEYVVMKTRDGGSMTAVGVSAEDYRVGHEFTATAAGSTLGATDQDENRVGRIFTTDEMVLGNFYMVYAPSEDSADITGLQGLGAVTAKRNEVFRATSTTATDYNFKLLLCKLERVSLQWAGRTDNGTDGINNVTGSVSVKGLKK